MTILIRDHAGHLLNGPNDVHALPSGHVYFTDPLYPRDYWTHRTKDPQQPGQHVYHLAPDRCTLARVTHDLDKPNGLVASPDGRTLYVADIGANKTHAFTIAPDGSLRDKRLFCDAGSDGITLDSAGNLYLTGGDGVTVYSPDGRRIATLPIPNQGWTANLCFASPDRQTLFITAGDSLYSVRSQIPGLPLPSQPPAHRQSLP